MRNKNFKYLISLIIPAIVAFIIYYLSITKKEILIDQRISYKICDLTPFQTTDFYKYNSELGNKLFATYLRIENTGNKSISYTDFEDSSLEISLTKSNLILAIKPDVSHPKIDPNVTHDSHTIRLRPDLLNPGDYINLYVYFRNDTTTRFDISSFTRLIDGKIKIISFEQLDSYPQKRKPKFFFKWGTNTDMMVLIVLWLYWSMFIPSTFLNPILRVFKLEIENPKQRFFFSAFFVVMLVLLIMFLSAAVLIGA